MRAGAALALCLVLAALALAALGAGRAVRGAVEAATMAQAERIRAAAGADWAEIAADGQTVVLTGAAPDAAARAGLAALLAAAPGIAAVQDSSTVAAAPAAAADAGPPWLEIVREGDRLTLAGLVPAGAGEEIAAAFAGLAPPDRTALAEGAAAAAAWPASLALGLAAARALDPARVRVVPCRADVTGRAPDAATAARLRDALRAVGPCRGTVEIASPPVLREPYRFALAIGPDGPVLEACMAPDAEGRARILAALAAAGLSAECETALGSPAPGWAEAVAAGVAALAALGRGRVSVTDLVVTLDGPGTAPATLAAALPPGFRLAPPTVPAAPGGPEAAPPEPVFEARRGPDGRVLLTGALGDPASAGAVVAFAEMLFGPGNVEDRSRDAEGLPAGWTNRAMTALSALALLSEGALTLSPGRARLDGRTAEPGADERAAALLAGIAPAVTTGIAFDAAAALRAMKPFPGACLREAKALLAETGIAFAPGSAELADGSGAVLDRLAAILRGCRPAVFEIGGHTDTSGRAEANIALSEDRALRVVSELAARGVPVGRLVARGYGPAEPVADNRTEAGRAQNRRIGIRFLEQPDDGR